MQPKDDLVFAFWVPCGNCLHYVSRKTPTNRFSEIAEYNFWKLLPQ